MSYLFLSDHSTIILYSREVRRKLEQKARWARRPRTAVQKEGSSVAPSPERTPRTTWRCCGSSRRSNRTRAYLPWRMHGTEQNYRGITRWKKIKASHTKRQYDRESGEKKINTKALLPRSPEKKVQEWSWTIILKNFKMRLRTEKNNQTTGKNKANFRTEARFIIEGHGITRKRCSFFRQHEHQNIHDCWNPFFGSNTYRRNAKVTTTFSVSVFSPFFFLPGPPPKLAKVSGFNPSATSGQIDENLFHFNSIHTIYWT